MRDRQHMVCILGGGGGLIVFHMGMNVAIHLYWTVQTTVCTYSRAWTFWVFMLWLQPSLA